MLTKWASDVTSEMTKFSQGALSSSESMELKESIQRFQVLIVTLFPAIIISSLGVIMWLNLLIISKKFGLIQIKEWKSPDWFVRHFHYRRRAHTDST
jgi:nitrate reductase NapE component